MMQSPLAGPAAAPEVPPLDLPTLERYLEGPVGGLSGRLEARLLSGGRSNPTYALTDGARRWVLRRPPHGLVLSSAHDMGREVTVLRALRGTAVPVPAVVAFDGEGDVLGAPFYVMDHLDGVTLSSPEQTEELTPDQRRRLGESMVDVLVALHTVDPAEVGLAEWGRPEGFLERQVRLWRRQWAAAHTAERPEVEFLLEVLERSRPRGGASGIVHGDVKLDNVLVDAADPGTVRGVLDWEMSTRGDTLTDLGVLLGFWDEIGGAHNPLTRGMTALPGFPTRAEMAARYAAGSGADLADLDWYVVLADVKVAIIFEQIHTRHLRGQTLGEGFDGVGEMVGPLLARAVDRATTASLASRHP